MDTDKPLLYRSTSLDNVFSKTIACVSVLRHSVGQHVFGISH